MVQLIVREGQQMPTAFCPLVEAWQWRSAGLYIALITVMQ